MAAIQCPDCKRKVSDTLSMCIHCGRKLIATNPIEYTLFFNGKKDLEKVQKMVDIMINGAPRIDYDFKVMSYCIGYLPGLYKSDVFVLYITTRYRSNNFEQLIHECNSEYNLKIFEYVKWYNEFSKDKEKYIEEILLDCSRCKGKGEIEESISPITCLKCNGKGKIVESKKCSDCNGNGKKFFGLKVCNACNGKGIVREQNVCLECNGKGTDTPPKTIKMCSTCHGTGKEKKKVLKSMDYLNEINND